MFKDTTHSQKFNGMRVPKLKGEVTIRLHNPTTGKTEIHKGENLVTNAVADIFAHNYCGALDYRKLLPLYSKMYGGVLCFANRFADETMVASDYYIPDASVNPVTAHAGQTVLTSQSDDFTRGNPSDGNMIITDGKATLAWEWGISGGNGVINAISLTHADVGNAGVGSNSQAFRAMYPYINAYVDAGAYYGLKWSRTIRFIAKDGYGYDFDAVGNTLTITRIPMAYEQTGLVAPAPYTDSAYAVTKTKSLNFTTTNNRRPYYCFDKDNDNLYLFYTQDTSTSVKCDCVNLTDWNDITITSKDFTAQYTGGVELFVTLGYYPVQVAFYNGSAYLKTVRYSNSAECHSLLRVNLSNFADQSVLTTDGAIKWGGGAAYPDKANKVLATKFYVVNNGNVYPTGIGAPDAFSGHDYGLAMTNYPIVCSQKGLSASCCQVNTGNDGYYYVAVSKFYLGTKYNLQDEVRKTPSQSMLITYTLTEVEPEEEQEEEEE